MIGEPDAGKPHVRFDEGVQETCGSVTRLCPTLHGAPRGGKRAISLIIGLCVMIAAHRRGCVDERK